jgi:RND family efflux transporter MFP subunit
MLGIEQLFKLGYAGKSELDRARLSYLQAESAYAAKVNRLSTELATLGKKENYEKRMELLTLEGAVKTAERNLAQTLKDDEALLAQAKAAMEAADEALKKEEELLARYQLAVENCTIHSPADGMVAYAEPLSRYYGHIRQGSPVRPRQKIITLPSLDKMQVKTSVHESMLDRVHPGLSATVRIDAFPEQSYSSTVQSVAVLPDQSGWTSADTKIYETIVVIDEQVEQLKPGMSAVVDIHVDRLANVLSIPVQAVVQVESDTWCYVDRSGRIERRTIELGRTNDHFVEIRAGLDEGDKVVLNPMAVFDESQQEEQDAAPDEEPPEDPEQEQPGETPVHAEAEVEPSVESEPPSRPSADGRRPDESP